LPTRSELRPSREAGALQYGLRMRSPVRFFALVFALSAPIWLVEPGEWPITAAVGVPLVASLILVYRAEGLRGVRNHLAGVLDQWKVRPIWYVPLFLLAPTLSFLNYLIQRLIGLPLQAESANVVVMVPLLFVLFFVLGIGEEAGWTGYATDPLQARWSALTTAVVLGLVTSLWHLVPLVKMGHSALWIAWWTVWSVPLRIFILWVYNNTAKSLFAAIVMHATINLSSSSPFIPRVGSHWDMLILAVLTWIVAIVLVGVWGPDTLAARRDSRGGG
jgi:membrane protease YdiL (CAAX protease family)